MSIATITETNTDLLVRQCTTHVNYWENQINILQTELNFYRNLLHQASKSAGGSTLHHIKRLSEKMLHLESMSISAFSQSTSNQHRYITAAVVGGQTDDVFGQIDRTDRQLQQEFNHIFQQYCDFKMQAIAEINQFFAARIW